MSNEGENVLPRLNELVPIYKKVKEAVLLTEYEKELKIPLTSMNELRNCLDHIMRILADGPTLNLDHEFIEAKAHLYRAANDAYEILVMHKLEFLNTFSNKFDAEALKEIYPDYYTSIIPLVTKSTKELAKVRSEKPVIQEEENTFGIYENIVSQLMQYVDEFAAAAPGIISYTQKMKNKRRISRFWDFLVLGLGAGLVIGTILLLIEYNVFQGKASKSDAPKSDTIVTPSSPH